ncbi:MFS transporter [Roseiflexus sp.]|uniref:MFS transporter n=1 Tax=Roseiflexus sp. TaxID=2562120 RepID=UPI0021DE5407|nr:MFS transporter [Roseiflexus sp.]GIW00952.1 MAG: MFS transporter [Roseiflexus sp.]
MTLEQKPATISASQPVQERGISAWLQQPQAALALVCAAVFVGAVDLTIVTAVLPKIMVDLSVSIDTELHRASWIITGYLLAYTISMTFTGRLSDLYGRRVAYMICLTIFTIGSIVVAVAPALEEVVLGRVVQALGAGALVPISMALVSDLFPPERRPAALGVIAAVDTAGWMVGHVYGGALMRLFDDWRLLFWLNVPFGVIALALTWLALRRLVITRAAGSFDWRGAVLISLSLTAFNIGMGAGAELGQTDFYGDRPGPPPYALPLTLASLVVLAAFIWVERRARDPLLDLTLFQQRGTVAASIMNMLIGFVLALAIANVPLFINTRLGLLYPTDPDILRRGAWETGLVLSALTLALALLAWPGGRLAGRFGERLPALIGLAVATAGYLAMSRWQSDTDYRTMVGGLTLAGCGIGMALAPTASAIITAAGPNRRGAASALVIILRLIGMTAGVSTLTLWGVQRQDALRRTADPAMLADFDQVRMFLIDVAAQVVGETFLFAVAACALALIAAIWLPGRAVMEASG